jgi:hypothetical protein
MCLIEGEERTIVLKAKGLPYEWFGGWIGVRGGGGEARCC